MRVLFRDAFFDGSHRWKRGEQVLPDNYPVEILPKSAKVLDDPEPELELKAKPAASTAKKD